MTKPSEYLQAAFGIVSTAYAKGQFARDKDENPVDPTDSRACTFCSLGAVQRVMRVDNAYNRSLYDTVRDLLFEGAEVAMPATGVVVINDYYPELIPTMWQEAIKLARAKEGSC